MEIIAGEQQLPNPDGFPQHIAPFPEPTDLVYDHPTAVIHSPDIINHRPISPPQKLRPIRSNAGLAGTLESGFLSSQAGCYDGELDCAVKVEGLASGNAYVAANDSVVVGSGHFVEGWERNGVERGLENDSR
ncbi:hypothetical protein TIFTF001_006180 [Ficus carica]|uniref:Uncharacterized protein n=1 Tax=Ficus carica TaxID=3494 RepID=A0AA87ZLN9_FICCA|nr:hypothetical protein TIFTF001_006180 [Ficus carica]